MRQGISDDYQGLSEVVFRGCCTVAWVRGDSQGFSGFTQWVSWRSITRFCCATEAVNRGRRSPRRGTETQRFNESMQHGDQSTTQSRMKNPYQPQHEIDATIVVCPVVNSRGFVQLGGVSVQSNKVSHNVLHVFEILGLMVIRRMRLNLKEPSKNFLWRIFFGVFQSYGHCSWWSQVRTFF